MNRAVLRASALGTAALLVLAGFGTPAAVRYRAGDETAPAQPARWTFDADPSGGLPPGAVAFSGAWAVRPEDDAPSPPNALCQTGTAEFPALVLGEAEYTDVSLAARLKPVSGRTDQAAGLIFRVQDADNYYILRANALEGNVNLYRYVGGQRSALQEGSAPVATGQWQELRAEAVGDHLRGL